MKSVAKKITGIGLAIMSLSLLILACTKSSSSSSASTNQKSLSVYLTDDPVLYNAVFIDIKYVEVKIDEDQNHDSHFADNDDDKDDDNMDHDQYGKWDTLSIRPGVYNIMKFRNGIDTLLAAGKIRAGRIGKVRITLGTNNSVVVSNVSYPLQLLSGQNKYVYVKVHDEDIDETAVSQSALWIDFDLSASIIEKQGAYYLKPYLKAFGNEKYGRIEGKVLPRDARSLVKVYNGKDTSTAIPEDGDGEFKIRGLKEGSYNVIYKGFNGYKDTTINNVQVQRGKETKLSTITLRK